MKKTITLQEGHDLVASLVAQALATKEVSEFGEACSSLTALGAQLRGTTRPRGTVELCAMSREPFVDHEEAFIAACPKNVESYYVCVDAISEWGGEKSVEWIDGIRKIKNEDEILAIAFEDLQLACIYAIACIGGDRAIEILKSYGEDQNIDDQILAAVMQGIDELKTGGKVDHSKDEAPECRHELERPDLLLNFMGHSPLSWDDLLAEMEEHNDANERLVEALNHSISAYPHLDWGDGLPEVAMKFDWPEWSRKLVGA